MNRTLKIVISLLIIMALISPMTKAFASFDSGECAVIVIVEGDHGTYKISNGEVEETFTGNSNNFFPSGTEIVLTAIPEEGYHVDGWYHCQENGEGVFESQGAPMTCETELHLTVTEDFHNILVRFDPGEELEEIRLSGSVEGIAEGVLPEFTVDSETEHVNAQPFGSNWIEMPPDSGTHIDFGSRWVRLSPEFDEWVDFPEEEIPEAVADSGIFYGMKVAVQFDPGYSFTNNTKIIYNDHDFTDTYSRFEPTENGGFVIVDMGQVFGEEPGDDVIPDDTEEQVKYEISCNDGEYSVVFYDHEGEIFELHVVDILSLTPQQIEEAYGMPAEMVEEVVASVKENVKDYGDLICLYAIDIEGNHYNYSEGTKGITFRIKITEAMENYNTFKFLFVDENNEFKIEEVHDVSVEETEEGKFLVIQLNHLSAYALVGSNVEADGEENTIGETDTTKSNPKTGDLISLYASMFAIGLLGLSVVSNLTKKTTKH